MEYKDILRLDFWGVAKNLISSVLESGVEIEKNQFFSYFSQKLEKVVGEIEQNGLSLTVSGEIAFSLLDGERIGEYGVVGRRERELLYNIYKYIDDINIQYYTCGERVRAVFLDNLDLSNFCKTVTVLRYLIKREMKELSPTFMPKPESTEHGAGFKINFHLAGEKNKVDGFSNGLCLHASECTPFTNSCVNSYARINSKECPRYICVGEFDDALIKVTDGKNCSVNFPDNSANPYLTVLALLTAGLKGLKDESSKVEYVQGLDETVIKDLDRLPMSLQEGLSISDGSGFLREVLGEKYSVKFLAEKIKECDWFTKTSTTDEYLQKYLPLL